MTKIKKSQEEKRQKEREKYRVKNWSLYNKALVNRGSITLWLSEEVISSWYYQGDRDPGGSMKYSDACLLCLLSIKSVFGLGYRQTQGFGSSLIDRLGLNMEVPSYSQICRRQASIKVPIKVSGTTQTVGRGTGMHIVVDSTGLKVYGEGEWKTRMHGTSKRRTWRKLHLAVDEKTNDLLAVELTTNAVDDAQMVEELVKQIGVAVDKFGGDGAYDKVKVYEYLESEGIMPIIPPQQRAIIWTDDEGNNLQHPRNETILKIQEKGLNEWKKQSGYHRRSKAEVAMFRYKTIFGPMIYSRKMASQKTEVYIKCACMNKFNLLGMPLSVKMA